MKIGVIVPQPFTSNEDILDDNYPVFYDYLYTVDGKVFRSDVQGNVFKLKLDLAEQGFIDSTNVKVRKFDTSRI